MFSRLRSRRRAAKALRDVNLQTALGRACGQHGKKHRQAAREIPWEEVKQKARSIREKNVGRLPELLEMFSAAAGKAGARVHRASSGEDAVGVILGIAREKKARLIVKSKSMVSEEIGLNAALEKQGLQVIETDLGEWIVQLAGERPSHITAPALHMTKERIAEVLSRRLGRPVPADAREIVRIAREEMRRHFIQADIGISGANLAIAESGTLVIVSNEGNVRLATTLPPVHIAVVTAEKFVETLEEAAVLIKALTVASSGKKLTSYVSFITGPSSTTDIEKEQVVGVHGPQEVHVVILDNGRLALAEDADFKDILYCLKCGGCMLACPVFQSVGGHVFGGPVYPGGIGTLLTAVTRTLGEAYPSLDLCSDCKRCEEFCPVGIPTGELLLKIKKLRGPKPWEKGLSSLFKPTGLTEKGAGVLAVLQKVWQKNGHLRRLPLRWARGKRIPVLKLRKGGTAGPADGPKAYLFQGCLVKYFFPEIRDNVVKSLAHFGYRVVTPEDQVCCGAPSHHLGDSRAVQALAARNLDSFTREDPDVIVTVCPTGNAFLKNIYPRLDPRAGRFSSKVQDFTAFMTSRGYRPAAKTSDSRELYYHFPCHYLTELKLGDKPPELLGSLGYRLTGQEEPPACCGFCGVFSVKNPGISEHLWKKKQKEILGSRAGLVATDCPGCLLQLRAGFAALNASVETRHTAELFGELLEKDVPPAK